MNYVLRVMLESFLKYCTNYMSLCNRLKITFLKKVLRCESQPLNPLHPVLLNSYEILKNLTKHKRFHYEHSIDSLLASEGSH